MKRLANATLEYLSDSMRMILINAATVAPDPACQGAGAHALENTHQL